MLTFKSITQIRKPKTTVAVNASIGQKAIIKTPLSPPYGIHNLHL